MQDGFQSIAVTFLGFTDAKMAPLAVGVSAGREFGLRRKSEKLRKTTRRRR